MSSEARSTVDASVNGNAPSPVDRIEIDTDGTLFAIYESGARVARYKIPLADVPSPDNMTARPGNVYAPTMMTAEKAADLIAGNAPLPPEPVEFYRLQD